MADEENRPEGEEERPQGDEAAADHDEKQEHRPEDASAPALEGTAEDVKSASPLEPLPGVQDSDSAAAAMKPATHQSDEHGLSHTTSVQLLVGVFAALTILTILTVAVTSIDLGSQGNFIVAMVIATVKACLVMGLFMHMLWDSKFNVLVFTSSFLFVLLFLAMSLADRGEYQRSIDAWETATSAEGG